jgi:hypothetical protein
MQALSESLQQLAAQVKTLEDSATAAYETNQAKLEKRRQEIDAEFKAQSNEFEAALQDAADAGNTWWNDVKSALKKPVEEVRARVEKRKSEHELHKAQRLADSAEEDAAAAVELAAYFLSVAEYAVVDATLARMAADDLAGTATVGASS